MSINSREESKQYYLLDLIFLSLTLINKADE